MSELIVLVIACQVDIENSTGGGIYIIDSIILVQVKIHNVTWRHRVQCLIKEGAMWDIRGQLGDKWCRCQQMWWFWWQ